MSNKKGRSPGRWYNLPHLFYPGVICACKTIIGRPGKDFSKCSIIMVNNGLYRTSPSSTNYDIVFKQATIFTLAMLAIFFNRQNLNYWIIAPKPAINSKRGELNLKKLFITIITLVLGSILVYQYYADVSSWYKLRRLGIL